MKYAFGLLLFVLPIIGFAQTQAPSVQEKDSVESARIIARYIDALGSLRNLSSVQVTLTGKTQGMESEMKVSKKAPNKFIVESFLNGKSISKQIYDGSKFSMLVQGYSIPVDDATKDIAVFEWSIIPELRMTELNIRAFYKGVAIENAKKYHLVEYQFPTGHKILNYFETETGLKTKTIREQLSAMGMISIITKLEDYKEFKGGKFAYTIIQTMGTIEQKMSVTSIEIDAELTDDLFKTGK